MPVPHLVTCAVLDEGELPSARRLVERIAWTMEFDPERLSLEFGIAHPKVERRLLLVADVSGYKALPPAWKFVDPVTRAEGKAAWPAAGQLAGRSSIFHTQPVLCAPFNRLAYKVHHGPHSDWGGPEAWLSVVRAGQVRAVTLAEMLQVIRLHLAVSPGMMS